MKTLSYFLLNCSSILPAFVMSFSIPKYEIETYIQSSEKESDKIVLRGHLKPKDSLRSGGDALSAILQGNTIQITFHKDVGTVSITIKDGVTRYIPLLPTAMQGKSLFRSQDCRRTTILLLPATISAPYEVILKYNSDSI